MNLPDPDNGKYQHSNIRNDIESSDRYYECLSTDTSTGKCRIPYFCHGYALADGADKGGDVEQNIDQKHYANDIRSFIVPNCKYSVQLEQDCKLDKENRWLVD